MRFGLGLSLCNQPVVSAAADYDPSELDLIGWWQASYSGSPWNGTASGGGSATRILQEPTNPPSTGVALNSLDPADFDGTNDLLSVKIGGTAQTLANFLGTTAWSVGMLVYADANGDASVPEMLTDTAGFFGIGIHNSGGTKACVYQYDTGAKYARTAASLNAWTYVQARFTGSAIQVRVDSGAWTSTACGAIGYSAGEMKVGKQYASVFFNGKIADLIVAKDQSFSDDTFDDLITYINNRYDLTL